MQLPTPTHRCGLCDRSERAPGDIIAIAKRDSLSGGERKQYVFACEACRSTIAFSPLEGGRVYRADRFAGKVITLREPWAWLITAGYKDVENRNWRSKFVGRILLHASNYMDFEEDFRPARKLSESFGILLPRPEFFQERLGRIVGVANFGHQKKEVNSQWFFGDFGWPISWAWPLTSDRLKGQLNVWPTPQILGVYVSGE